MNMTGVCEKWKSKGISQTPTKNLAKAANLIFKKGPTFAHTHFQLEVQGGKRISNTKSLGMIEK